MRAYLIDPVLQHISTVEYDGSMQQIYEYIDATLMDTVHINAEGDAIYVDDEGLFKHDQSFFILEDRLQPLAGKGLVLGVNWEGESCSPIAETLETLRRSVTFVDTETAIIYAEKYDEQNQKLAAAHPEIIFCSPVADMIKDAAYSGRATIQ